MRFLAYNQHVHKMLHRWGPNVKEMMAIKKYLATQSISFNHPPWVRHIKNGHSQGCAATLLARGLTCFMHNNDSYIWYKTSCMDVCVKIRMFICCFREECLITISMRSCTLLFLPYNNFVNCYFRFCIVYVFSISLCADWRHGG
jgi:hypothetical protein